MTSARFDGDGQGLGWQYRFDSPLGRAILKPGGVAALGGRAVVAAAGFLPVGQIRLDSGSPSTPPGGGSFA